MSGEKPEVGDEVMAVGRVVHVGEVTVWVAYAGDDRLSGRPVPLGAIRRPVACADCGKDCATSPLGAYCGDCVAKEGAVHHAELATLRAENERLRAALTKVEDRLERIEMRGGFNLTALAIIRAALRGGT